MILRRLRSAPAACCLADVIITFTLMLGFVLIRGEIDERKAAASEASLDAAIERHLAAAGGDQGWNLADKMTMYTQHHMTHIKDGSQNGVMTRMFPFGGCAMSTRMLSADTIRAYVQGLAAFALSVVFTVAALPVLAQQQQQAAPNVPTPAYGYGHMMWGGPAGPGWGNHHFMIVGPIFALLAIIGLMAIFVWLVRWATRGHPFRGHGFHHFHGGCPACGGPGRGRTALDILEERLAKGEIEKTEFEEKRKLLGR